MTPAGGTMCVAVFVKTPGLSPVKTRLAAGIGGAAALTFYRLACSAVEASLAQAAAQGDPVVVPYWAVAEPEALARWPGFPVIPQGEGALGERLAAVYAALRRTGGVAVLVGADAPQLGRQQLRAVQAALATGHDFVIGPAADGGFYLFAGTRPVPNEVWTSVPYSSDVTAERLAAALAPLGRLAWLAPLTDADSAADLPAVARELAAVDAPTPAQVQLRLWLEMLVPDGNGAARPSC